MTAPTVPEMKDGRSPESRLAMREMMAAFDAFKRADDARMDEIEAKVPAPTEKGDGVVVDLVERLTAAFNDMTPDRIHRADLDGHAFAIKEAIAMIAATQQATGEGENLIGAAEREVGQAVYERIEHLIGGDSPELAYLAELVESVEEYGSYSGPTAPLATQQAVSPPEGCARCGGSGRVISGTIGGAVEWGCPECSPAPDASQDQGSSADADTHRNAADGGSSNEGGE